MKPFYEDEEYLILFSEISWVDKDNCAAYRKNTDDDAHIPLDEYQCKKLVKKYKKWLLNQSPSTTHEISLQ